jgi:hypothetical protein
MKCPRLGLLLIFAFGSALSAAEPTEIPAQPIPTLPSPTEARARAQLLHAAFDGTLRIMHRDFFHKGDSKAIPSESLKDVFKALAETQGVAVRWLASAGTMMNVDNKAKDAFEEQALKTITSAKK